MTGQVKNKVIVIVLDGATWTILASRFKDFWDYLGVYAQHDCSFDGDF